jgi:beta-glucosidase-like glycosyl hydrolase
MNIEKKIARLIYPGFWFGKTNPKDAVKLVDMGVGGFCLYFGGIDEVRNFTATLRKRAKYPLLFCSDHENGPARWTKGSTWLPSNMAIGASDSKELAHKKGQIIATEARALGVDWIFAPVLDLAYVSDNPIVNTRSFGKDPDKVSVLAKSLISGMKDVLCCIKHFPGHGDTNVDSHLVLPYVKRSLKQLKQYDIKPFKNLLSVTDSIMVAHLKINALDDKFVTTCSEKTINGLLRKDMGYKGCVFTDGFTMDAIPDDKRAALMALLSGADVVLVPRNPFATHEYLVNAYKAGILSDKVIDTALKRQLSGLNRFDSRWYDTRPPRKVIGCKKHSEFNDYCAPKCITWYKKLKESLKKGQTVSYLETGISDPKKWERKEFVKTLKKLNVNVVSALNKKSDVLIVSSFFRPWAGFNKVKFSKEDRAQIKRCLKKGGKLIVVSFGSPFIFEGFGKSLTAGICAFCAIDEFQRHAAKVLCGKAKALGKMPVDVK